MRRGIGRLRAGGSSNPIPGLFPAGEQGGWYDPGDFSAEYQDGAGTTPVIAVTNPVGLFLDKRLPVGPEMFSSMAAAAVSATNGNSTVGTTTTNAVTVTAIAAGLYGVNLNIVPSVGTHYKFIGALSTTAATLRTMTSGIGGVSANTANASVASGTVPFSLVIQNTVSTGVFSAFISAAAPGESFTLTLSSVVNVPGNHLTQATGGSRPLEQQPTAFYATKSDGLDDYLATTTGGGGTAGFFYCAAINPSAIGANQTLWADTGTNTGYRVRLNATNQLELAAGNNVAFTTIATVATVTTGTTYVVTAWHDGVNLNVQINSNTVGTAAFGTATAGTAAFTDAASNGGASGFFNGYLFNRVYKKDSALTSAQRAQVQQYIANKAGVTL